MPGKNICALALLLILAFSAFAFGQTYTTRDGDVQQVQVAPGEAYKLSGTGDTYVYVYQTAPGFTLNAKWAEMAILSDYAELSDGDSFHGFRVHLIWENDSLKEIRLDGAYESDSPEVLQVTDLHYGTVYKEELYNSRAVFTPAIKPPLSLYYKDYDYSCPGGPSMRTEIKLLGNWYVLSSVSPSITYSPKASISLNREKAYGIINVGDTLGSYSRIKLSDISVAQGACRNVHPAILDILAGPVDEPLDTAFRVAGLNSNNGEVYITASYDSDSLPVEGADCFVRQEGGETDFAAFAGPVTGKNPWTWGLHLANGRYEKTFNESGMAPAGVYTFTAYCSRKGYKQGSQGFQLTLGGGNFTKQEDSGSKNSTNLSGQAETAPPKPCEYKEPSIKILESRRTGTSALDYTVRIRGASTGDCAARQYRILLDIPPGWAAQLEGSPDVSVTGTNEIFRRVSLAPPFPDSPAQGEYTFNAHLYSRQAGMRIASDAGAYVYREVPEISAPLDSLYSKDVNGIPVRLIAYSPSSGKTGSSDVSLLRLIVSGRPEEGKNISQGNYSLEVLSLSPAEARGSQNKIALRLRREGFPTNRIDAKDGDVIPVEYSDGKAAFVSITGSSLGSNYGGERFAEISLYEQEARGTLALGEKIYGSGYSLEYEGTKETDGRPVVLMAVIKSSAPAPQKPEPLPPDAQGSCYYGYSILGWNASCCTDPICWLAKRLGL